MSDYQNAILGQILLDADVWHRAGLIPQHFVNPWCREVFTTMTHVLESGEPLDMVTLKKTNVSLDSSRLAELTDSVPSASNYEFYAEKVKEEARRHWLWRLAGDAKEQLEGETSTDEVLGSIEDGLVKIALAGRSHVHHLKDGPMDYVNVLEERYNRKGELPGVTTGFEALDEMFGGFEAEKLYYIGARPSKGKSALLLNMLKSAAESGRKGGLISLESSTHEAYSRLFADLGQIHNSDIRKGFFGGSFGKITAAAEKVHGWDCWICDDPELTVSELKTVARKMVIAHGVEVLFVDYLQYIRTDKSRLRDPRHEQVAETSRALKALARSLGIPIVAAVQLTRAADDHVPRLGDFAESSGCEKDADVAILIHSEGGGDTEQTWLKVQKNRDGQTGDVVVRFEKEYARFRG